MIAGIPKISVLIITYKQEELIKRAIDSLLAQKEYVYEICVSDDCSPDNTWEVLQEYDRHYPGLFKLNRNEPNLGIFSNIEKAWTMCTGELVYTLAGDDECPKDWFKTVIEYVLENRLDYRNDYFAVYGNYQACYPNGDSFVFSNKAIISSIDPIRLSLRGIIGNRSAVFTRKVLESFKAVSVGKSYIAESAQDRQLQLFAKTNYYIPLVGNIYYARVGVSVHFSKDDFNGREGIEEYAQTFLESQGYSFNQKDLNYIRYRTESCKIFKDKSLKHRLQIIWFFVKSLDVSLLMMQVRPKRYLFALLRRLPHKKPLSWVI